MKNFMDIITILLQSVAGIYVLFRIIKVDIKIKKLNFIKSFLCFLILMLLSNFIIPNHLRSIFSILVLTSITFYITRGSMIESLASSFVTVGIIAIVEVVFSFILVVCGATQQQLVQIKFWNFIANLLVSLSTIFS